MSRPLWIVAAILFAVTCLPTPDRQALSDETSPGGPVQDLFQTPGMPGADELLRQMKEQPAGDIDTEIRKRIADLQNDLETLRHAKTRLELLQRSCGSNPAGSCRDRYDFFRDRYDRQAARVRAGRLSLRALYLERVEIIRTSPARRTRKN